MTLKDSRKNVSRTGSFVTGGIFAALAIACYSIPAVRSLDLQVRGVAGWLLYFGVTIAFAVLLQLFTPCIRRRNASSLAKATDDVLIWVATGASFVYCRWIAPHLVDCNSPLALLALLGMISVAWFLNKYIKERLKLSGVA